MKDKGPKKSKEVNKIPGILTAHDSSTGLLRALSDHLKGRKIKALDTVPSNELFAGLLNSLPVSWRKGLYSKAGKLSATNPDELGRSDLSEIDKWVCDLYPEKKYPAIAIGSSNGALVHLFAAMGIPWLPQTVLISVDKEKNFPIDDPKATMEWAKEPAETMLQNNPEWQLHHMMDPVQDRLKVDRIGYFRIKKIRLGTHYQKFIEEKLMPGGKIIVIDCSFQWPVKQISNRHFFQFGGAGGLNPREYYEGSPKAREFLGKVATGIEKWDAPIPEADKPEAEWGFEKKLLQDIKNFTDYKKIEGLKIDFNHPQSLSSIVARVYRKWYEELDIPSNRLLVETFNVISPHLSLQKTCIPYWLFFNVESATNDLENFISHSRDFEEIYMMILSHGKKSVGYTPASRYKTIMEKATKHHAFVGTDPEKYPVDLAFYSRYDKRLEELIPGNSSFPGKMEVEYGFSLLKHYSKESLKCTTL